MKNFIFSVSLDELRIINDALMRMQYFKAAPVIDVINRQLSEQTEKPNADSSESLSGESE